MKVSPLLLTLGVFGVGLACGASGSSEARNRGDEVAVQPAATPAIAAMPAAPVVGAPPSLAPLVKALAPAVVNLEVMKAHKGDVDGKKVKEIAERILGGL